MSQSLWAGWAVFILLVLCVIAIAWHLKKNEAERAYNPDYDITPSISIAEGFCVLMEKRGLERFLMRDYVPGVKIRRSDLKNPETARKKLHELLCDILKFLELPASVRLRIDYGNDSEAGKSQAGSYSRNAFDREIAVKIQPFYGPANVLAIMCHEAAHYFMEYNRLNWNDTYLNEQRTDIVANLTGFSKIMREGYREIKNYETSFEPSLIFITMKTKTTTHKIGYINVKDCADIGRFLAYFRKNLSARQEAKIQFDSLKQKTSEYIETAKTLAGQAEYISIPETKALTPEQIMKIQRVLAEKESRNIPAEIRRHEQALQRASTPEQLGKVYQDISGLCGELSAWLNIRNLL